MAAQYETGALWSTTHPASQRTYYEQMLLETLRTKSILVPFTAMKEDFRARDTGIIVFTEVYDTDPNFNALSETGIWLTGSYLDSRSVQIAMEIHGDVLKFSDYNEVVNYWNNGDLRGLIRGKLGQNQVDYLDILARNAFLSVDDNYKIFSGTGSADRFDVAQTDIFDPDLGELVRVHLEEREIPGVVQVADAAGQVIVCATTPRVVYDIRTGNADWLEVQEYEQTGRKFTAEAGMWAGVRYVRTNRLKLFNHGTVGTETTIPTGGDTVVGQGAAATVDTVYTVGQSGSTRYISVDDSTGFAAGDLVTISEGGGDDGGGGHPPLETDGTQETRRIVSVDTGGANRLTFDKPLLKPHSAGDYVTKGVHLNASIFMGGPAVAYGVGERPHPTLPPKIDDLQMVQRFGWRGFLKFQMFRPEWIEVVESGGSVT
jgi:N4-gp56 family major capsid protein